MVRAVSGDSDQLIDSALWLDVQGDRTGAMELLKRVLTNEPGNQRALVMLQRYEAPPPDRRRLHAALRRLPRGLR